MRIDFHSHLLPRGDHGCDSAETAAFQLQCAAAAGMDAVCITPHFYPNHHTVAHFLKKREAGVAILRELEGNYPFRLIQGAEVLLCEGLERMDGVRELCLEGTDTLLLELPDRSFGSGLQETVIALQEELGLHVVYAHIERYPAAVRAAATAVCPHVQMNVESARGLFGGGLFRRYARAGMLEALGSDMHRTHNSYAFFQNAEKALGKYAEEVYAKAEALLPPQA